jgi:high-affinity nickel-transport protein
MIGDGPLIGVALGLGLGARHALEPDHLAAVSALAADRPGARRGLLIGALWGLGHTLSLLCCGLAAAIAATQIPSRVAELIELAVAAMLIVLGARAVLRARPERQVHVHGHDHCAPRLPALRAVIVGAVHGLAGSGALVALATAAVPTVPARVAFIGLFGFGSIAAMSAISACAGWPLARLARRPAAARSLLVVAGAVSVVLGVVWGSIRFQRLLS